MGLVTLADTDTLSIVVDGYPDPEGEPDRWEVDRGYSMLFQMIRRSREFPRRKGSWLLDMGSGDKGSYFVHRYGQEFPDVTAMYLDCSHLLISDLDKPLRVCADAIRMPFPDGYFDIVYAGHIINGGVLENCLTGVDSCLMAKEAHRILKKGGGFIFTYSPGNDDQTRANLFTIGFKGLNHLLRVNWMYGIPTDTYLARK